LLLSTLAFPCISLSARVSPRHLHSFPTRRSSDLFPARRTLSRCLRRYRHRHRGAVYRESRCGVRDESPDQTFDIQHARNRCVHRDRKSTRLNSSHVSISYAVFCLKKKKQAKTVTV